MPADDITVRLRPFRDSDLGLLERFGTDPNFSQPFESSGFASPQGFRRRWKAGGFLAEYPTISSRRWSTTPRPAV